MINIYKNIYSPYVIREMDIYEFLDRLINPDEEIINLVYKARHYYSLGDEESYSKTKASLPCYTLNFSFHERKANESIKAPTGFIYIDLDNVSEIDLSNPYIFASWKSLSNNGRGILIKVKGLNVDNFSDTYIKITNELGIDSDKNASKPTQYNIQSYDKDTYINNDSLTWLCEETILSPTTKVFNKKKKDSSEMGELKFNSIHTYDFKGKPYIFFEDEKELIATVYIPNIIEQGNRNNIISTIAFQTKALNPNISMEELLALVKNINNKRCFPPLQEREIINIVRKVHQSERKEPQLNKERRIIFNPEKKLSRKQKAKHTNTLIGKQRSNRTINEIREFIDNWDVHTMGKITQTSLAKAIPKNIKTIEKYYHHFKDKIISINEELSLKKLMVC